MGNPIIDWLAQNFLLLYFFFMTLFLIVILVKLRMTLGPFFSQSMKVSFGLMRDPNLFIQLLNSKTAVIEWRSYNQVIKLDPEDPTSELVYVDRQHGWTPAVPLPTNQKGFLNLSNLFGQNKKDLNTIYTDDFVPVEIKPHKNFFVMGRQMHIIFEGQNITQNPLDGYSQDAQVKKAGIAVEHQLIANKLLAESEFRNKIATKDDVRNFGLLNLFILGIGIVAAIMMIMGLQSGLDTFAKFVTDAYNQAKPLIDKVISEAPKVIIE